MDLPHKENTEFYDENTLENNPSLKYVGSNLFSNPPYTYKVDDIIRQFPIIHNKYRGYDDIVKIYPEGTLTTTLTQDRLQRVKDIFKQYQEDTPYSNDFILRLFKKLNYEREFKLRDVLLAGVQAAAKLPEDCFVTMSKSYLGSTPKPEFSMDKLELLLKEKEDLKKHFTDAIKNELKNEATKWENTELRTLWKAIRYMD